jgi:hypothetical protein
VRSRCTSMSLNFLRHGNRATPCDGRDDSSRGIPFILSLLSALISLKSGCQALVFTLVFGMLLVMRR